MTVLDGIEITLDDYSALDAQYAADVALMLGILRRGQTPGDLSASAGREPSDEADDPDTIIFRLEVADRYAGHFVLSREHFTRAERIEQLDTLIITLGKVTVSVKPESRGG